MILQNKAISITDIQSAIGSNSNNVGYLCSNNNINPWSKYKPVTSDNPTLDILIGTNYKGSNNCNIQFIHANSIADALSKLNVDRTAKYIKIPLSYPKRMGDFRNYNSDAIQPWYNVPDKMYNHAATDINVIKMINKDINQSYNLMYKDIYPTYKLGAIVVNSLGKFDTLVTSTDTIGNNSYQYNLIPNHSHWNVNNSYTVYNILFDGDSYTFENNINNINVRDIVLLPLSSYSMKFIKNTELSIKLNVYNTNPSDGSYCFDIYYTNKSGKDYHAMTMKYTIYEEEWDEELQDTITTEIEHWQDDLSGWLMANGEIDEDFRVGGCLSIKNFRPQATYYIMATLVLQENVADITSARELIV